MARRRRPRVGHRDRSPRPPGAGRPVECGRSARSLPRPGRARGRRDAPRLPRLFERLRSRQRLRARRTRRPQVAPGHRRGPRRRPSHPLRVAPAPTGERLAESASGQASSSPARRPDTGSRSSRITPRSGCPTRSRRRANPPARIPATPLGRTDAVRAVRPGASLFYDWVDDRFGAIPARRRGHVGAPSDLTPAGRALERRAGRLRRLRTSFKDALGRGRRSRPVARLRRGSRVRPGSRCARVVGGVARGPRTLSRRRRRADGGGVHAVDTRMRPKGARLRFEATGKQHARMLWTLVRVDAAGHELAARRPRAGRAGPRRR